MQKLAEDTSWAGLQYIFTVVILLWSKWSTCILPYK